MASSCVLISALNTVVVVPSVILGAFLSAACGVALCCWGWQGDCCVVMTCCLGTVGFLALAGYFGFLVYQIFHDMANICGNNTGIYVTLSLYFAIVLGVCCCWSDLRECVLEFVADAVLHVAETARQGIVAAGTAVVVKPIKWIMRISSLAWCWMRDVMAVRCGQACNGIVATTEAAAARMRIMRNSNQGRGDAKDDNDGVPNNTDPEKGEDEGKRPVAATQNNGKPASDNDDARCSSNSNGATASTANESSDTCSDSCNNANSVGDDSVSTMTALSEEMGTTMTTGRHGED